MLKKMQHCLKLRLMVDVDVQGTSKITNICQTGPRGHCRGHCQWDTQADIFRSLKL